MAPSKTHACKQAMLFCSMGLNSICHAFLKCSLQLNKVHQVKCCFRPVESLFRLCSVLVQSCESNLSTSICQKQWIQPFFQSYWAIMLQFPGVSVVWAHMFHSQRSVMKAHEPSGKSEAPGAYVTANKDSLPPFFQRTCGFVLVQFCLSFNQSSSFWFRFRLTELVPIGFRPCFVVVES